MTDRVLIVYINRYDGVTRSVKIPKAWAESPRKVENLFWPHQIVHVWRFTD